MTSNFRIVRLTDLLHVAPPVAGMCFASKTGAGQDYRGSRDFSQEGITCQAWSSQYPHPHSELTGQPAVDDANGIGKHNFCRNPGGRKARPWCFVLLEKVEWQYCDIRICWYVYVSVVNIYCNRDWMKYYIENYQPLLWHPLKKLCYGRRLNSHHVNTKP